MNIILSVFPTKINVCNINTDFRVMIQYEKIIRNDKISEEQKIKKILDLFYIEKPKDVEKAIKGLNWFYQCGKTEKESRGNGSNVIAYDFEQDDYFIFSAFYQTYGIDLEKVELHWWKFSSLLLALPKDTLFMEIVGYRVADTRDMPKKMKAFYNKQKATYAIKRKKTKHYTTLAEKEAAFKQEMDRKYYKALEQMNKSK